MILIHRSEAPDFFVCLQIFILLYLTMINIHRFGKLFSQQGFFLLYFLLGNRFREERGTGFDFLWNLVLNKASIDGSLMLK